MTAPHICDDTTTALAITNHLHRNPWGWQALAWTCLGCGQDNPGTGEHCSQELCQENTSSSRGRALQTILDKMEEELILMGDPQPNTAVELLSIELILEILFSPHERTLCGLLERAYLTPTEPSSNTCICVKALGLDTNSPVEEMAMLDLEQGTTATDVDMEEVEDLMEVDRLTVSPKQATHSWANEVELFTSGQASCVPLDITDENEDENSSTHPVPVTTAPYISTDIRMRNTTNTTNTTFTGTSTTTNIVPSTSTTSSIVPNTSTSITVVPLTSSERRQIHSKPPPRSINYQNISTPSMPLTTTTRTASSSSSSATPSRPSSNFSVPRHTMTTTPSARVPAAMFWWCWDGLCGYSNALEQDFCRHCGKSRDYRPDMIARQKRNSGE